MIEHFELICSRLRYAVHNLSTSVESIRRELEHTEQQLKELKLEQQQGKQRMKRSTAESERIRIQAPTRVCEQSAAEIERTSIQTKALPRVSEPDRNSGTKDVQTQEVQEKTWPCPVEGCQRVYGRKDRVTTHLQKFKMDPAHEFAYKHRKESYPRKFKEEEYE